MRSFLQSICPQHEHLDLYLGVIETAESIIKQFPEDAWRQKIKGDRTLNDEVNDAINSSGLMGLGVDEQYGGMGGGLMGQVLATDVFSQAGLTSFASVLTSFCRAPLLKYGTDEQKAKYALPTISGEKAFCILATEPDAGTNTFNIKTRATKQGDKWILNGQKTYITEAHNSDYGFLIAKTDLESPGALSIFVVDMKSPGVTMHPMNIDIAAGEKQFNVFFDNVEMPADALVGEEGKGGKYMFEGLNAERLMISAWAIGYSDLALKATTAYTNERKLFGENAIASYQAVQHPLAKAKAETDAARLMIYHGVQLFDSGMEAGPASNMAKYLTSTAVNNMCDAAIQFHGGSGMDEDTGMLALWRISRVIRIAPINNEMILNYIAEHVIGLPKSY
ncbi:MAG: acyl-CoA/acyl-ACP dehydrogenase [Pseudomonadales bacterium]|nr:acyl-CoA/acyl-ACP dehydrogenase [Pseudomonadales bacterium]